MPLIDLKTNFKSLKFGKDRIGGGSSNQPYITKPIPDSFSSLSPGMDFVLRDGPLALERRLDDVSRLTQMFFDTKSPNGILFTAKQESLSRQQVETLGNPERIYNPANTLAQVAVQGSGIHYVKQGSSLDVPYESKYEYQVKNKPNRLEDIYNSSQIQVKEGPVMFTYKGGPGAPLGYGTTEIYFSKERTGINSPYPLSTYLVGEKNGQGAKESKTDRSNLPTYQLTNTFGIQSSQVELPQFSFPGNNILVKDGDLRVGGENIKVETYNNSLPVYSPLVELNGKTNASDLYNQLNKTNSNVENSIPYTSVYDPNSLLPNSAKTDKKNFKNQQPDTKADHLSTTGASKIFNSLAKRDKAGQTLDSNQQIPTGIISPSIYKPGTLELDPNRAQAKDTKRYQSPISLFKPGAMAAYNRTGGPSNIPGNNKLFEADPSNLIQFVEPNPNVYRSGSLEIDPVSVNAKKGTDYASVIAAETGIKPLSGGKLGASIIYQGLTDDQIGGSNTEDVIPKYNNVYTPPEAGTFPDTNDNISVNNTKVFSQRQIIDTSNTLRNSGTTQAEDFRSKVDPNNSTPYKTFNRVQTYGEPDSGNSAPGARKYDQVYSYQKNKQYRNDSQTIENGQLIKFLIKPIDNESLETKNIYLRAYIDEFQDQYEAGYNGFKYVGRAEEFYTYNSYKRSISLAFTVAAESKDDIQGMYNSLNALVGVVAPDYSGTGFMRNNFIKLTLGDYLRNVPGFITGFSLSPILDAGFDIARTKNGSIDTKAQQLPFAIKVSGFNFTPIENFTPQKGATFIGNPELLKA